MCNVHVSLRQVVEELKRLARLGVKEVSFVDDLFTAEPRRVKALCQGLIEQQVDITWFANTRADRVNPELCNQPIPYNSPAFPNILLLSILRCIPFYRISYPILSYSMSIQFLTNMT